MLWGWKLLFPNGERKAPCFLGAWEIIVSVLGLYWIRHVVHLLRVIATLRQKSFPGLPSVFARRPNGSFCSQTESLMTDLWTLQVFIKMRKGYLRQEEGLMEAGADSSKCKSILKGSCTVERFTFSLISSASFFFAGWLLICHNNRAKAGVGNAAPNLFF